MSPEAAPRDHLLPVLVLTLVVGVYLFGLLGLQHDDWFEDDATILSFVRDHPQPLNHLIDRDTVYAFTKGRNLTPLVVLSFWLDDQLAPGNPLFAYLHMSLLLFLTVLALYYFMTRLTTPRLSLAYVVCWLMLPSTISTVEFLSTRHYLSGLMWTALAGIAALNQVEERRISWLWACLAQLCFLLAALEKEVYVTGTFWLLFSLFLWRRHLTGLISTCVSGSLYATYRIWAIGLVPSGFEAADGDQHGVLALILRLPYLLTASSWGLLVLLVITALSVRALIQRRFPPQILVLIAGGLILALITILPVAAPLIAGSDTAGPWYRIIFFFNSLLLAIPFLVFSDLKQPSRMVSLAAIVGPIFAGGIPAARIWDEHKQPYTREARYYRTHPDRLIYSEVRAAWFLPGIHTIYHGDRRPHFIHAMTLSPNLLQHLKRHDTIWRFDGETWQPDETLAKTITLNLEKGIVPLHAPIDPDSLQTPQPASDFSPDALADYVGGTLTLPDPRHPMNYSPEPATGHYLFFHAPHEERFVLMANDSQHSLTVTLSSPDHHAPSDQELAGGESRIIPVGTDASLIELRGTAPFRTAGLSLSPLCGLRYEPALQAQAPGIAFLPHIPDDDKWLTWLFVANPSASPTQLTRTLFGRSGNRHSQTFRLPAGQMQHIPLQEERGVAARLEWDAPLILVQVYEWRDEDQRIVLPAPLKPGGATLIEPVDPALWQGLVLLNPTGDTVRFPLFGREQQLAPYSRLMLTGLEIDELPPGLVSMHMGQTPAGFLFVRD